MDFLDNLILGKNTPLYADESTFPSKTYKKNLCRKKHCDKNCLKYAGEDWDFWAMVLSCKPLDKSEIGNRILNMKECMRYSVWYRMCSDIKMDNNDREGNVIDDPEVIQHEQRDKEILKLILKRFRYKEIDEEKLFEMIIQTLNDNSININIFLDFIYNILDMPYADLIYLKVILKFMNDKLKLFELFSHQNNEDQDVLNNFIEYLVKNNFDFFSKIIDLILCYQNTTFREAMLYFVDENKTDFELLITVQNLNKLKDFLRKKKNTLKEVEIVTKNTEPTYYDFLVVQNETIKAQEHIKEEYITKITELENKNKELESSLEHFKEISTSLEEELTDYQDNYVKEISRLLDDTKKENDVLQKEILKLRDELCRNKRTR
ncbi:hypothetical protein NBO_1351g0001 [Nosema bombycis CQ1]|uniref:Uncharacterized protein n=1 Tax=Nosema bombycis (strain CQ1 / CVCC 102059) TaxID=578461 RepID=R0LZM5_NOSB1|nr:hypothetical protein NBO_1351g0001 [Nosema bombycis CQ1]|eukprot:EOB11249.1 hypothetical protein NBO_1351g0001 [Nosema bombycis CQ1]